MSKMKWLAHKLLWLVFATLPFTYALTLKIGFPLKIYELACIFLIPTLFVLGCLNGSLKVKLNRAEKKMFYILGLFLLVYIISAVLGLRKLYVELDAFPAWAVGRFHPIAGSIFKVAYLIFDILLFLIILRYSKSRLDYYIKAWLVGGILASIYTWYLFTYSIFGLHPFLLPGMKEPLQVIGGFSGESIIRSGTFLEGNFMGAYLLLSVVLCLYMFDLIRSKWYLFFALFFSVTLLTTFSTINILLLVAVLSMYFLHIVSRNFDGLHKPVLLGASFIGILICLFAASKSRYVQKHVFLKLFNPSESKIERLNHAITGLRIFSEYPLTGVGPGNYGFYYPVYQVMDDVMERNDRKKIPNNIYVELLSESGIIGFLSMLLFISILLRKFRNTSHRRNFSLFLGMISICLLWMAYPTFLITFQWVYFAVCYLAFTSKNDNRQCFLNA